MAQIKYNGKTLAEITTGQSITLHTDGHELEGDLVIEGFNGGGSCSGNHVIEVTELPETGVEGAIYKLNQPFGDLIISNSSVGMVISLSEVAAQEGLTVSFNTITSKADEPNPKESDGSTIYHCYYIVEEDNVFVYGEGEWHTISEMLGAPFNGTITDPSEATVDGIYMIGGISYYIWKDEIAFSDILIYNENTKSLMSETFEGDLSQVLHEVETKPTENIAVGYYYVKDDDIFMYGSFSAGGTPTWISLAVIFANQPQYPFRGEIFNVSQATEYGYYAVMSGGWERLIPESQAGSPPPSVEENKTVTPTKSTQTVKPSSGYDYLAQVTVAPIPSGYIIPSGTMTITENDTYDVKSYASAKVEIPDKPTTYTVQTVADLPEDAVLGSVAFVLGGE